ncbi:dihydrolipoyl dehydrogenase [Zooshikella harenae]|uniref:Dihydrolipoyl dehydrogenase n=1 Tax=Zooshikella harenae TaxID=2827238 RepID=A0ABS5Z8T0_9GAMM|nr:dihydrolipoyl dehydrogenase [Zooshikella harenae]MBU2710453.1 dihydrolipoyl dehydrogenase [Zooshikella harenae]
MSNELSVDVAIIGSGTAGLGAYRAAKAHTDSVVLIESGAYGTTCARVGCMPSKLLIAAAEAVHHAKHTDQFGVYTQGPVEINGQEVMARVKRERDRFVGFVLESVEAIPDTDKLKGHAQFIDKQTLLVDDQTKISAKRIVIATGSRPTYPASFAKLGERLIINDDLFAWDDLPSSVAVFGTGVIGLELGQALHRLGLTVRVFGLGGAIGPLTDPELLSQANQLMAEELAIDADARVTNMERSNDQVVISFKDAQGHDHTECFDYVLAATGRRPNVDHIGLENTGVKLNEQGVPVFDRFTLQCGDQPIFIAGDANNDIPLLHEAADEGRIAGDNAGRYPDIRAGQRRASIGVVFSDPQIAVVGKSFHQLQQSHGQCGCFATGKVSFADQGRSRVMGLNKGSLHVYGENGTGILLGAEMIGPRAEHLAHLLAWAIQQRLTVAQILEMPFYHPVIEEGVRTALRDLNSKLHLGPAMIEHCLDCGPGA